MKCYKWRCTAVSSLVGLLSTTISPTNALAAERLVFYHPPFGDFELSTQDLEVFVKQGKITDDFAFYVKHTSAKQRKQLRELLQIQANPALYQMTIQFER